MRRKRQSAFEDAIDIAAMLPWKISIVLAVLSYFGFHYLASLPPITIAAVDPKNLGQSMGSGISRQLAITFGMFLQYLVPLAFLIGAAISVVKQRRQSELHEQVASNPNRGALEGMSWREFEGLTAELFRRKGYTVVERGGNGPDGGVDLELKMGSDKYLVQCKQWKVLKVGVATVRELYGVMAAERAVGGFVVASGEFTDEARNFAEGRSIKLVHSKSLLHMIRETSSNVAQQPIPATTTPSCPKCGSSMVKRTAKRGDMAGTAFWGCSQYPSCRGTKAT